MPDAHYDYVSRFLVLMCNIMRHSLCSRVGLLFIDWVRVSNPYILATAFLSTALGGIEGSFCTFPEYGILGLSESLWFYAITEHQAYM